MVADELKRRDAQLGELEARLGKREAYDAGDYCTCGGSLWCAIRDMSPGDAPGRSASWRLAVKSAAG